MWSLPSTSEAQRLVNGKEAVITASAARVGLPVPQVLVGQLVAHAKNDVLGPRETARQRLKWRVGQWARSVHSPQTAFCRREIGGPSPTRPTGEPSVQAEKQNLDRRNPVEQPRVQSQMTDCDRSSSLGQPPVQSKKAVVVERAPLDHNYVQTKTVFLVERAGLGGRRQGAFAPREAATPPDSAIRWCCVLHWTPVGPVKPQT